MDRLTSIFKALSDPSRLRIFHLLLNAGELCVCDIEAALHFPQTKVSRHLALLKKAGLLRNRRRGLWILYSVSPGSSKERKTLYQAIVRSLTSVPNAQKDQDELARIIRRGSCATVALVRPKEAASDTKV